MGLGRSADGFAGWIGGLDERLGLGQQGWVVGLQRQGIVGACIENGLGGVGPTVQGVGGDDTAVQGQQRQGLLGAEHLVASRRQTLADHQSGLGRPHVDQMQRRGLAAPLIGPAQSLAVDRHNPLQGSGEGAGELGEGRFERLRLEQAEHPAEGVVARRAVLQLHHLAQEDQLGAGELRHVRTVFRPAQRRRQRHEHQFQQIVTGIARPRVVDLAEIGRELLHQRPPSGRHLSESASPHHLKSNAIPLLQDGGRYTLEPLLVPR